MEYFYFVGTGPEAEKLINMCNARQEEAIEARKALMSDWGSDGLMQNCGKIIGLCFKQKTSDPWLCHSRTFNDSFGYIPNRRYKKGKDLKKALTNPDLDFNASDFILDHLKMHHMVVGAHSSGMALYHSTAGTTPDRKILVRMPTGSSDPVPDAPDWLNSVKESEFLAAQGK